MGLALYVLPILLQVVASRVHHHHHHHDALNEQDKLAGVDLADLLIPILSKQELESKAHNQSDEKIHALKKLIQKSHVAIILAKPHKGENHSIDSKHVSSQEVKKHKHLNSKEQENVKHHSFGLEKEKQISHSRPEELNNHLKQTNRSKLEDLNLLNIANSDIASEEDNRLVSLENNEETKQIHINGLNKKHEDKEVKHKESPEYVEDDLALNVENLQSHITDIADDTNKQQSVHHSINEIPNEVNSHEVVKHKYTNTHLLEKNVSHKETHAEKEEHEVNIDNSKNLNSSDENSRSGEDSSEDNNLYNTLYSIENDDNSYEYNHKDDYNYLQENNEKNVLKNEKHKEHLEHEDEYLESSEERVVENYNLHQLKSKQKESRENNSHELKNKNKTSVKLASQKGNQNNIKYLKEFKKLLDSRDGRPDCVEDSVEDYDSLLKNIDVVKKGKSLHFYEKHDNNIKRKDGIRNLFFHFAL